MMIMPILLLAAAGAVRCNLNALTPEERMLHAKSTAALKLAIKEQRELPDGYKVRFLLSDLSPFTVMEWVAHERRCCPFLRFNLEFEPENGPAWLTLTGPEGTKEVLKGAFQKPKD